MKIAVASLVATFLVGSVAHAGPTAAKPSAPAAARKAERAKYPFGRVDLDPSHVSWGSPFGAAQTATMQSQLLGKGSIYLMGEMMKLNPFLAPAAAQMQKAFGATGHSNPFTPVFGPF